MNSDDLWQQLAEHFDQRAQKKGFRDADDWLDRVHEDAVEEILHGPIEPFPMNMGETKRTFSPQET